MSKIRKHGMKKHGGKDKMAHPTHHMMNAKHGTSMDSGEEHGSGCKSGACYEDHLTGESFTGGMGHGSGGGQSSQGAPSMQSNISMED